MARRRTWRPCCRRVPRFRPRSSRSSRSPTCSIRFPTSRLPRFPSQPYRAWASSPSSSGVAPVGAPDRSATTPTAPARSRSGSSPREFIRGAAFDHLEQELPYAVSVEVDEYREDEDPVYIRATIFVERESQKGMVIGRGGRTIKTIGQTAREATETLLGQRVYLDLRVKVLPKWRKSPQHLRRLGLPVPESRT